jgi:DnaJ homolog subfamily B member 4
LDQIDSKHREQDIEVVLDCELCELYNGCIKEVNIARKQMLSTTEGSVINAHRFNVVVQPGFSEETKLVYP